MKKFEVPEFEIITFEQKDIIAESCTCVECGVCPEGDHCQYHDDL